MKTSAIVSAYYAEEYIEGRIKNLLQHDCEIVVVCQDGSTEEKITRDAKVHVITTPDIPTVYAAWNLGIKAASGDYVTSANSDDRHYPGSIKILEGVLDNNPDVAVAYFDVDRFDNLDEKPTGHFKWREGGFSELYWKGCFVGPMPLWRKSLHDKYGYFDESYTVAGDYEFWMRITSNGEKLYHVRNTPLGAHLEHDSGLEHRSPVRTTWETSKAKSLYRKVAEHD